MAKKQHISKLLQYAAIITAFSTALLGIAVLFGWYTHTVFLIQVVPDFVPMQYNTALLFFLCSIGIISQVVGRKQLAQIICGIAGLLGFLTLLQYLFGVSFGIDQLFMDHYVTVETSHPGRMAPNTALGFTLTGLSVLILNQFNKFKQCNLTVGVLGAIIVSLGIVAFSGYLSGVTTAYGWGNLTRMAVHTSIGFTLLGLSVFILAWLNGVLQESTIVPNWLAFPIGIGVATVSVALWQAIIAEYGADNLALPYIILISGLMMAILLVLSIKYAQISRNRAKALKLLNQQLEDDIIERKQAEMALRESEKNLQLIYDTAGDVLFQIGVEPNNNFRFLSVNKTFLNTTGLTEQQLIGKRIEAVIPEPSLTLVRGKYEQAIREKKAVNWEETSAYPTGLKIGDVTIAPALNKHGICTHLIGSVHDITERKQAEEALRESEATARALLNAPVDTIMLFDARGIILDANETATHGFSKSRAELIGLNVWKLFSPDASKRRKVYVDKVFHSGQPIRFEDERAGMWFDNVLYPVFDEQQKVTRVAVIARDITERKQAEESLRKSEANLKRAQTVAHIGSWHLDIMTDELFWSDETHHIFGMLPGTPLTYSQFLERIHPTDRDRVNRAWTAALNQEPYDIEHRLIIEGQEKWVRERAEVEFDQEGNAVRGIGTIQDITERKQAEEALQQHAQEMSILNALGRQVGASLSVDQVVSITLDTITSVATPDLALIYLRQEDQLILQGVYPDTSTHRQNEAQSRVGDCLCGLAVSQRKSIFSSDIHCDSRCTLTACKQAGLRSFAALPLQKGDQVLGVLGLAWALQRDFGQEAIFWETLVNQVAIGLQNAFFYEQALNHAAEMEQRVLNRTRELSTLYQVTAVASQPLDLQTTLAQSLEQVLAAMKSEMGSIHLLDEVDRMAEGERLTLAVQQGFSSDLAAQIVSVLVGDGLVGWVIEHDKPLLVPDITTDSRVIIQASRLGPKVYAGVPMRTGGHTMGVLSVLRETTQPPFSKDEIALLTAIADHVGVVVESARLRQQVEQAAVMEERQRLARELHDSVTQSLYSLTLLASGWRKLVKTGKMRNLEEPLIEVGEVAQQALKEMRLLVYELRPPILEKEGLLGALHQRLGAVEKRAGIEARLIAGEVIELPVPVEEGLYRITQEALNNALKHAAATSVIVHIGVVDEQIELEVVDNGQGFTLDTIAEGGGMGLTSMQERAAQLGAELQIISTPGEGTTVRIAISC